MIERIGSSGALAREALRAALAASERAGTPPRVAPGAERVASGAAPTDAAAKPADAPDFAHELGNGIAAVERDVQAIDRLPEDLLTGRIDDFHEIAVQLKSAELSFRFAMEIRNKLVDAYREIMRMTV